MIRRMLSLLLPVALPLALVLLLTGTAWACPGCKDNLSQQQVNMARGYYYSILFMMSMPFLLVSSLGAYFYWQIRKARSAQAAEGGAIASAKDARSTAGVA